MYDIAVVGAGVVGSLIARELCKYELKVALIEKASDVACGATKGNSAIVHAGFDAEAGSLKAMLNVKGCEMMPGTARELGVHYEQNGSLVCAFTDEEAAHLEQLRHRGEINGVRSLEIIAGDNLDRLFTMEPNLSREVKAALHAPTAGIVCPYLLTIAAAEHAVLNGCDLFLNFEAAGIQKRESENYEITSSTGEKITTRFIVNSAGLYSDEIARLCGEPIDEINQYEIIPRRGEYMLMDKNTGATARATLFSVPSDKGKGILVSPTVDGNLLIGPNAIVSGKDDVSTTMAGLAEIREGALRLIPGLNMRQVITSFAGARSTPKNGDFNIFVSNTSSNILHLIGIESPGLASSPAIAEYSVNLLSQAGLCLTAKRDTVSRPYKKAFRNMSDDERIEAISINKAYAKIICRCESVTEAEIIDAIKSPCPATTLDAVKRRARAGMGRCQGGFCSPRIVEILSRELGIDMIEITKKGADSYILTSRTK